jgi:hypothetical protein
MRQGNGMEAVDAERVLHRTKGEKGRHRDRDGGRERELAELS